MTNVPRLLDEAGEASIATAVMMSHHGFRRDIRRFGAALEALAGGRAGDLGALRDEWRSFRATLHGHHAAEDTGIFPGLAREHEALRPTLERLGEDHRRIDPLLERGDGASPSSPGRSRPPPRSSRSSGRCSSRTSPPRRPRSSRTCAPSRPSRLPPAQKRRTC